VVKIEKEWVLPFAIGLQLVIGFNKRLGKYLINIMSNIFTEALENTGLTSLGIFFLILVSSHVAAVGFRKGLAWIALSGVLLFVKGFTVLSFRFIDIGWGVIWLVMTLLFLWWGKEGCGD